MQRNGTWSTTMQCNTPRDIFIKRQNDTRAAVLLHRHRRQRRSAAVPIRPRRACQPGGPTFVSEPDRFRGHGSDLLESSADISSATKRPFKTFSFSFGGNFSTALSECVHHGWSTAAGGLTRVSIARLVLVGHASDVTGPVTWLQQLVRLAAQQIGNSQSEKCKVADLGRWRGWQGGLGWGNWRGKVLTDKICSEKVFGPLS